MQDRLLSFETRNIYNNTKQNVGATSLIARNNPSAFNDPHTAECDNSCEKLRDKQWHGVVLAAVLLSAFPDVSRFEAQAYYYSTACMPSVPGHSRASS